ncbi:hypothetical protein CHLRE_12g552750v5 [Chlamydomonas reinhardtii]|uniref:Uncharacterized protein n=1 Tax=Chlamydomonas reinhardtii TaxID=3055 RepID=A0A2K3D615_CHLRE|nr:uncharacterized protein CHLRE_12g552750v5 [Chlamydomonas reinhardtii]PNW75973.1 hypothetical protein CHLRE_12g552750v5 [Chlamydomonas reinhardtii]
MDPIVEEFHEADLFEDDNGDAASSVSSEEDIALEEAQDGVGPLPNEAHDDPDTSSAKSSLIQVTLASEQLDDAPHTSARISASMPAMSGHIRMGSSVPVSIPHMARWKKADASPDSPTTIAAPATFVPPHQLSGAPPDFAFSFTGDSPSVAIKRERLRARNAILKSTGFLEPGVQSIGTIGVQEQKRLALAPPVAGGLSQALQQRGNAMAQAAISAAIQSS